VLIGASNADFTTKPWPEDMSIQIRSDEADTSTVVVLVLATIGLVFVGLLAVAGFTVMAQRRLRALGILGAIGASHRHIRLALLANGLVIGAVGALAGATLGVAGWIALSAQLESLLGHRIDRLHLPWTPGAHRRPAGHCDRRRRRLVAGPRRRAHSGRRRPLRATGTTPPSAPVRGPRRPAPGPRPGLAVPGAADEGAVHPRRRWPPRSRCCCSPRSASPPSGGSRATLPWRRGWRCATWRATVPGRARRWPRSDWPSASPPLSP
jgi:hypothetical protein